MLKFDYLVKNIEIFMGQFIMPFCFERQNVQFKIVKINSELLKIKKIKQSQKVVVQAKFKIIYVKIWQKILLLMQTEPCLRVHSNYVAILQLIHNLDDFIEKSQQHLLIYAELSGDFPLGDSRQPTYKSLRPFDLVS